MRCFPRSCFVSTALLGMMLLASSVGKRLDIHPDELLSLEDWDISQLADYLNHVGLEVQLRSTQKDGGFAHNAYLTTIPKDWDELNRLSKGPGPRCAPEWRGVVYCERVGKGQPGLHLWGDHYLAVGPFYLYGDVELLDRIGVLLEPSAP